MYPKALYTVPEYTAQEGYFCFNKYGVSCQRHLPTERLMKTEASSTFCYMQDERQSVDHEIATSEVRVGRNARHVHCTVPLK